MSALVGQALDRNSADRLRIEAARRQTVRTIGSAWNQMETARRNVAAQQRQLEAARIYYEGSFEEYRAGLRSTFDVLFAQNALRDTEIALLASTRDQYVAQAALLRQLGLLETGKVLTGTALYDPSTHTRQVMSRGSLPWDALLRTADSIGAPGEGQQQLEMPARLADKPQITAPSSAPPEQELIRSSPITPIPGTTGAPANSRKP